MNMDGLLKMLFAEALLLALARLPTASDWRLAEKCCIIGFFVMLLKEVMPLMRFEFRCKLV